MTILFIAEMKGDQLSSGSHSCLEKLSIGQKSGQIEDKTLDLIVFSAQEGRLSLSNYVVEKCRTIFQINISDKSCFLAENIAPIIANMAQDYALIISPHSHRMSPIAMRVAALLNIQPLLDVINILDRNIFEYPIYNGLFIKQVRSKVSLNLLTLHIEDFKWNFEACFDFSKQKEMKPIEILSIKKTGHLIKCKTNNKFSDPVKDNMLQDACLVIGCGGGVESEAQYQTVIQLARELKALIGGSKVFIDQGFLTSSELIGQSGKVIAPHIYLALGISGSMHHLSGVMEAKIIISVNKDPEASIIALSDYSLIGDIDDIIPELVALLKCEH